MKSGIISILKDASDVSKILRLEGSGTLKAIHTNQDCIPEIFKIIPCIHIEFETIKMSNSILQMIL